MWHYLTYFSYEPYLKLWSGLFLVLAISVLLNILVNLFKKNSVLDKCFRFCSHWTSYRLWRTGSVSGLRVPAPDSLYPSSYPRSYLDCPFILLLRYQIFFYLFSMSNWENSGWTPRLRTRYRFHQVYHDFRHFGLRVVRRRLYLLWVRKKKPLNFIYRA